jgi:hypothetical protein
VTSVVSNFATQRIVVEAAPVTVTAKPPFVVSAVKDIAHAVAPADAATRLIAGVPINTVEPALAPRMIAPLNSHAAPLAAPVTLAMTEPLK